MFKLLKLYGLWKRVKQWWTSLKAAVASGAPFSWSKKVDELTTIANDALDTQGLPETPKTEALSRREQRQARRQETKKPEYKTW
jgi:hypothetical protein